MKQKNAVYQVSFNNGQTEHYSQLKKIYANHSRQEIGCGVNHIWNFGIEKGKPFKNEKVSISLLDVK